ncbi:MAG: NADH-quinone oxidoreductase subunit A [Pyrinomonadaceae bacterium]
MKDFNLFDYAPILVMAVVALGFALSQLLVAQLIGPRKRTSIKLMPYECGKDPVGSARDRFSVKFYMVAVAFLLFDLEILFVIPFAVAFKSLLGLEKSTGVVYGTAAFLTMIVFLSTVIVGLIYEWKKGAFDWSEQSRLEAKAEAAKLKRKAAKESYEAAKAA